MNKIFLTDVDGVLLHWTKPFTDYVRQHLQLNVEDYDVGHIVVEDWLDIHPDEATRIIEEFHQSEQYFSCLPAYDDAIEGVTRLHDMGWKFVAITACGPADLTYKLRVQNLERYWPKMFEKTYTLGVHESKEYFLRKYCPTFWVDDTPRHVVTGAECGHKTFWMHRPDDDRDMGVVRGVTRVTSWYDILERM